MAWTKEQQTAINTSGSNIIVSAGAGSGKTAVLTTRVIEKVKTGTHIDELLILTFTNEAAKEMKNRIKDKLKQEGITEELNRLDAAYITTFDSFALSIVKKYHYLLNIPKAVSITDSSILSLQKDKILAEILEEYYTNPTLKFTKLITDFCNKDDKELQTEMLNLADTLEIRTDKEHYLENYIKQNYNDQKYTQLLTMYHTILKEQINVLDTEITLQQGYFETDYEEKLRLSIAPLKQELSLNELIALINNTKLPPTPRGSEEETKIAKESVSNALKELKTYASYGYEEEILSAYQETQEYLEIIMEIIQKYFQKLTNWKRNHNAYDFTDIAHLSLQILKQNTSICQELKNSLKEIMVDEYQDTSDTQEEFISLIESQNIYMVGDIKQSIYRFRNANPYIFKEKYDAYAKRQNGIKIDLLKNFRSRSEVLDNINTIFNPIMTNKIGNAEYTESHQMVFGNIKYNEQGNTRQNYNMDILEYVSDLKEFSKEEIEIFTIAKDILEKIKNSYLVFDKDKEQLRPVEFKDFCIIMDRNSSFDLTKKIFEYLEMPLTMYKDEVLSDSMDLYILKNLVYLLIASEKKQFDKQFEYAFTSISRSYLYNLKDETIFDYLTTRNFYDSEPMKDILKTLPKINTSSTKELLEDLLENTKFYEKIITHKDILDSTIRMEKIMELANNLSDLNINIYKFYDYLSDLINKNKVIKFNMGANSANAVKIMNIHKSKGLEFPICYFAGLYKKFSTEDLKGNIIYEKTLPIYTPNRTEGIKETFIKLLIKDKITKEDISEKIRLFYVALTRAKEKIILLLPKIDNKEEQKENGVVLDSIRYKYKSLQDMLNSIPKTLERYKKNVDVSSLNLTKDYKKTKDLKTNIDSNNQKLIVKELKPITKEAITTSAFSKKINSITTKEEKKNISLGLKIHSILEYIDFKNFKNEDIPDPFIANLIEKMLQNKLFENINEANIFQEYEFVYTEEEKQYHGIIDLMLEYPDHIDIIDYKLNNILDDAYLKQLNGYKHYIETIAKKKVNTYLFSILSSELKKLN